jgi:hypothetical protein
MLIVLFFALDMMDQRLRHSLVLVTLQSDLLLGFFDRLLFDDFFSLSKLVFFKNYNNPVIGNLCPDFLNFRDLIPSVDLEIWFVHFQD